MGRVCKTEFARLAVKNRRDQRRQSQWPARLLSGNGKLVVQRGQQARTVLQGTQFMQQCVYVFRYLARLLRVARAIGQHNPGMFVPTRKQCAQVPALVVLRRPGDDIRLQSRQLHGSMNVPVPGP
jgi:hypothetical protein